MYLKRNVDVSDRLPRTISKLREYHSVFFFVLCTLGRLCCSHLSTSYFHSLRLSKVRKAKTSVNSLVPVQTSQTVSMNSYANCVLDFLDGSSGGTSLIKMAKGYEAHSFQLISS
ncbi:hypothetical protein NHQ30_002910 [Ciborinia camelliae]|nr:hypothetical protein NHQ30_002910 [Ciborinia camelliae]